MSESTTTDFSQLDGWEKRNSSWKTKLSYASGAFAIEMVSNAFGGLYFLFYETELHLGYTFLIAANVLFAIWNAVNDPLLGWISEKKRPFWKRWGKRGFWLAISIPPMYLSYALLFNIPKVLWTNDWLMFIWLFFMLCMADTFYSLFYVHWMGTFPEKFQNDKAKRSANVFRLYLAIGGVVLGNIIPLLLYDFDEPDSYGQMAWIVCGIGALAGVGVIYGTRQSPRRKAMELELEAKQDPFWSHMKMGLKTRSYVAYLCFYFGSKIWDLFFMGTLPYYTKYVLGRDPDDMIPLLILFIVGQMLAVPLWTWISKKKGFRTTMILAGFTQALTTLPIAFTTDFTLLMVVVCIAGFGNGAMWTMLAPVFSEALDELSLKTGKRDSGVFIGINTFFGRFIIIVFTFATTLIHIATGFDKTAPQGTDTQPNSALRGIIALLVIVPVVGLAIAISMFAWLYDIKGEKKIHIEAQKIERSL
ncbi:MAG: MFS transporter [Promethearchaeota archaeon]